MFRYRLRTLLLLTILGPPMLGWISHAYLTYRARIELERETELVMAQLLSELPPRPVWQGRLLDDLKTAEGETIENVFVGDTPLEPVECAFPMTP